MVKEFLVSNSKQCHEPPTTTFLDKLTLHLEYPIVHIFLAKKENNACWSLSFQKKIRILAWPTQYASYYCMFKGLPTIGAESIILKVSFMSPLQNLSKYAFPNMAQLSNLWWIPNSVRIGLCLPWKRARQDDSNDTPQPSYMWVSSWLLFTVD